MKSIFGIILGLALMMFSNINASANYKFSCEVSGTPCYFDEIDFPFIESIISDRGQFIDDYLCPIHLFSVLDFYFPDVEKASTGEHGGTLTCPYPEIDDFVVASLKGPPFDIENDQGCVDGDMATAVAFAGYGEFFECYCDLCGDPCIWNGGYYDEPFYKTYGSPFYDDWYPYNNYLCPRHFFEFERTGSWDDCGSAPNQEKLDSSYLNENCTLESSIEEEACIANLFPVIIHHSSSDTKPNLTANAIIDNCSNNEFITDSKLDIILPTYPAQRPNTNSSTLYCSLTTEPDPCDLPTLPFDPDICNDDIALQTINGVIDGCIPFPYQYFPKGGERDSFEDSNTWLTASAVASLVTTDFGELTGVYDANLISRNFDCPCCRRFYNGFDDPCWENPCGHTGFCPPGR